MTIVYYLAYGAVSWLETQPGSEAWLASALAEGRTPPVKARMIGAGAMAELTRIGGPVFVLPKKEVEGTDTMV